MTYNTQTRQVVESLRKRAKKLELSAGARLRLSWFAFALDHNGNISLTCKHFGISRSTYHRWAERFDPANPRTLEERSKRPKKVRNEETPTFVIELIRLYRSERPTVSKGAISERLQLEHGLTISASTVGRVIARHGFFFGNSVSHRLKRTLHDSVEQLQPQDRRGFLNTPEDDLGIFAS